MSAAAIGIHPDGNSIHLLSDGMIFIDDKPTGEKFSKVFKVNDSLGFIWLGALPGFIDEALEKVQGIETPKALAEFFAEYTRDLADHPTVKDHNIDITYTPLWIFCIGFDGDALDAYHIFTPDEFDVHSVDVFPGYLGSKTYSGFSDTDEGAKYAFQFLFRDTFWPLYSTAKNGFQHAAMKSFQKMIDEYQKCGELIGGEIFTETLIKP